MGNDQHAGRAVFQQFQRLADALPIEVVRWLIHQHQVRFFCEKAGQGQAGAFAAGKRFIRARIAILRSSPFQQINCGPFRQMDLAAVWGDLPGQNTQQGGLTAAVDADQAGLFASWHLKGNILEQCVQTE